MGKRKVTKEDRMVSANIKRLRELKGLSRRELEEKALIVR
jgi:coproporphyrinogen III oxidase-like Fe-S oxidoreductase